MYGEYLVPQLVLSDIAFYSKSCLLGSLYEFEHSDIVTVARRVGSIVETVPGIGQQERIERRHDQAGAINSTWVSRTNKQREQTRGDKTFLSACFNKVISTK